MGKSTLLNALVGEKTAIVSPKPQTTRNRIVGIVEKPEAQIVLVDTPGIHRPRHQLGNYLVAEAKRCLKEADLILFVVDGSVPPGEEDRLAAGALSEVVPDRSVPVFLVINKKDRLTEGTRAQRKEGYRALIPVQEIVFVSALYGDGLEDLVSSIVPSLPEGPPYYPPGTVMDQPEKFLISERIREAVVHFTREEVPHAVAVLVDDLDQTKEDLVSIRATIYVEKESQKGIIIGEGGRMLKQIGTLARQDLENWFGKKVFLKLWVKVAPNWRKDPMALVRLGYKVRKG